MHNKAFLIHMVSFQIDCSLFCFITVIIFIIINIIIIIVKYIIIIIIITTIINIKYLRLPREKNYVKTRYTLTVYNTAYLYIVHGKMLLLFCYDLNL